VIARGALGFLRCESAILTFSARSTAKETARRRKKRPFPFSRQMPMAFFLRQNATRHFSEQNFAVIIFAQNRFLQCSQFRNTKCLSPVSLSFGRQMPRVLIYHNFAHP